MPYIGNTTADFSINTGNITNRAVTALKLSPSSVGSNGQVLSVDGSGNLQWASDSAGIPASGGTFTGDISFNDNISAKFGAGFDLTIKSNGSSGFIQTQHSGGTLYLGTTTSDNLMNITASGITFLGETFWTNGNDIKINDSSKILVGTGNDLTIQHSNSSNISSIGHSNAGGSLQLSSPNSVGVELYSVGASTDYVLLRYGGGDRLFTTAEGIKVQWATGNAGEIHIAEGTSNGSHTVALTCPASVAASYKITLPGAVPTSNGQVLAATTAGIGSWIDVTALSGSTNNTLCTVTGANAIQGEANLTFDGTDLVVNGAGDKAIRWATGGTNKWTIYHNNGAGALVAFDNANNQERLRIDSSGRILYGISSSTRETSLVLVGNSNSYATNPGTLDLFTGNTPSNLGGMGQICFGTQNVVGARIDGRADQDWTVGSARGTHLRFLTCANGSTNLNERLRISNSGDLHFRNATTSPQGIKFYKDNNLGCSFTYGENTANPTLNIYRQDSQSGFPYGNLIINTGDPTNPTQAIKLRTDKHIEFTGSLIMASGQGIDFSANSHAGGKTSEVLDDYEEGLFTPGVTVSSGSLSVSGSYAYLAYTKVGRMVHIAGHIVFDSASSPSGNIDITGMPFTCANLTHIAGSASGTTCTLYANGSGRPNSATGVYVVRFGLSEGSTSARLEGVMPNYDGSIADWFGNGADLLVNFSYTTAD